MSFDALFDQFTDTAFRLEAQPAYLVGEEDARLRAWREHAPRPERSVRTDPWLARIAVTTAAGKRWQRVRVVDYPLPWYLRYELAAGYGENQTAGDETLLVDRAVIGQTPDWWLFDAGTDHARAAVMHYDSDGRFLGFDLVDDPDALADLDATRARLLEHAVPLNAWLNMHAEERRVA